MNKLFTTILLSAFASASFASTPNLAPATGDKTPPKAAAKAEVKAEAKIAPAKEKASANAPIIPYSIFIIQIWFFFQQLPLLL